MQEKKSLEYDKILQYKEKILLYCSNLLYIFKGFKKYNEYNAQIKIGEYYKIDIQRYKIIYKF